MALRTEKDPNRKKKSITWDENCIREQDKDRGTRMKIMEVNTPYNYETWDSGSEDDFSHRVEHVDQESVREEVTNRLLELQEQSERKKQFEERRKKHYDEFKTMKALKEERKLMPDE